MIEKLECTCIEAYTTRKMRDPNCCACSCDHNDLVEQLAKANERVRELERKVESEKFKKEEFVRWVDRLIEEQKELREQRFRTFGGDEYLIFFDDGEDYPESMVAPVVMGADKFRELYYAREQLRKEQTND